MNAFHPRAIFGSFLHSQLQQHGYRQTEVAEKLGVTSQLISQIVHGHRPPSRDVEEGLCQAMPTAAEMFRRTGAAARLASGNSEADFVTYTKDLGDAQLEAPQAPSI